MKARISWVCVSIYLSGIFVLAVLLYLGPPVSGEKSDLALRMMATALSIIAGMLLAVMILRGEPESLYPGDSNLAKSQKVRIIGSLDRYVILFWSYLLMIALALVILIIGSYEFFPSCSSWVSWTKHAALSLGCLAVIWALTLPIDIRREKMDRLENEIERQEEKEIKEGLESIDRDMSEFKKSSDSEQRILRLDPDPFPHSPHPVE